MLEMTDQETKFLKKEVTVLYRRWWTEIEALAETAGMNFAFTVYHSTAVTFVGMCQKYINENDGIVIETHVGTVDDEEM